MGGRAHHASGRGPRVGGLLLPLVGLDDAFQVVDDVEDVAGVLG
jgi:hypothetical protein